MGEVSGDLRNYPRLCRDHRICAYPLTHLGSQSLIQRTRLLIGNGWLLQEIKTRLPGREWKMARARPMDVATLAGLLRETAEHHDHYEKTHTEHHWWDWYPPYLRARQ